MRSLCCLLGSCLIISLMGACTSNAEKKASADFQRADALIARKELAPAMQLLDSIRMQKPL